MSHERKSTTSQRRVFVIRFFASSFIPASIPLIEYIIPFTTMKSTQASPAMKVAYFIIFPIILIIAQNPVQRLHSYLGTFSLPILLQQFAPGTFSVTVTFTA